jgi:3-oxoacyl-[acyl-carrier protein] reductase
MDLGLTGKVAMVGGASRGLGFAVARVLLQEGAKVSIASSNLDGITAAATQLQSEIDPSRADHVLATQVDLRTAGSIDRWFEAVNGRFGGVDLLFVNTGGPPAGAALSFDDDAWKNAFDLLVMSAVRQIRLAVPSMTQRGGGSIVVSTSSSVKEPIQNLALSNVLRASVGALAKTLSNELAGQRIRVNHLLPGRIDTDRVRQLDAGRAKTAGVSVEEQKARTEKTIPLGRYGDAEEFAKAAAFLLSDASAYTTGASLQVDGGMIRGVL